MVRFRHIIAVAFVLTLISLAVVAYIAIAYHPFGNAAATATQSTFETNDDRRFFLNKFLPQSLPSSAKVRNIDYVSWMDATLTAEIEIPISKSQQFLDAIVGDTPQTEGQYRFECPRAMYMKGTISPTDDSEIFLLECKSYNEPIDHGF